MDDYQLALAHYRLQFPDLNSLGSGNPPVAWNKEYQRVAVSGLSATLVTSMTMEGGGSGAVRNFDPKALLSALHARRGELDRAYLLQLTSPPPVITQPAGSIVRLGH